MKTHQEAQTISTNFGREDTSNHFPPRTATSLSKPSTSYCGKGAGTRKDDGGAKEDLVTGSARALALGERFQLSKKIMTPSERRDAEQLKIDLKSLKELV